MMRIVCSAALCLSAAPVLAQVSPPGEASSVLTCTGPFTRNADEAALVKAFGRANVGVADLDGAEGQTERGTVLFGKDPARRVEIFWWDVKRKRRPASIRVRDGSVWLVKGEAAGLQAVRLGSTLAEVETANGRPFSLSGFGWDYGGLTNDWKGGTLGKLDGGCSLSLRFNPDPKAKDAALDKASGDGKTLRSDQAAVRIVKPTVSEMSLGWPE